MKIIHIASEMTPIAKVGGLGDVVYGLSMQQVEDGDSVEIVLPYYACIDKSLLDNEKEVKPGVVKAEFEGLPLILLGHYSQIYGNDAVSEIVRFSRFCKEAKAYLKETSFDVIHLHDWPVGLLAPMLKLTQPDTRIVLSIHNFYHQGKCSLDDVKNLNLPLDELTDPHDPNTLNILKGALAFSDAIVAVSPKYAREILTEKEGSGLDQVLKKQQHKLSGILNGIDTSYWNPNTDPFLVYHYSMDEIDTAVVGKESNRAHLFYELKMDRVKTPLVCAITRLVPQKGLDAIEKALEFTLENGGNFILLGSSPFPEIQSRFHTLAEKHQGPNLHCHFVFDERLAHMTYAASDMIVIPSVFEPCGLTQMIAMRYGCVPIVRCTGGLADTVENRKNGFSFTDPEDFLKMLTQAFDCYRNQPQVWKELMLQGQKRDCSWKESAKAYRKVYNKSTS